MARVRLSGEGRRLTRAVPAAARHLNQLAKVLATTGWPHRPLNCLASRYLVVRFQCTAKRQSRCPNSDIEILESSHGCVSISHRMYTRK